MGFALNPSEIGIWGPSLPSLPASRKHAHSLRMEQLRLAFLRSPSFLEQAWSKLLPRLQRTWPSKLCASTYSLHSHTSSEFSLALGVSNALTLANSELWSKEVSRTIGFIERTARIDVEQLVATCPPLKEGRALRRAFYDAMAVQMQDMCPSLSPIGADPAQCSLHVQAAIAWWTASPDTFLPRGPFRLAWAAHLCLPAFPPSLRCHYRPLATGIRCHAALGQHSGHVHSCAHGPRQRRHSILHDAWLSLCRAARWHAETEQQVRTGDDVFHRADIMAAAPDGT